MYSLAPYPMFGPTFQMWATSGMATLAIVLGVVAITASFRLSDREKRLPAAIFGFAGILGGAIALLGQGIAGWILKDPLISARDA